MDYYNNERIEELTYHLEKFLSQTEDDSGKRNRKDFIKKVFDKESIQDEIPDIINAHNELMEAHRKQIEASHFAIDLMDSFINRLYLYKMDYMYTELWLAGYVEPTSVDKYGSICYKFIEGKNNGVFTWMQIC